MNHLRLFFALLSILFTVGCATASRHSAEPVTRHYSDSDIPQSISFKADWSMASSLVIIPTVSDASVPQAVLLSIDFIGRGDKVIAKLIFRDDNCNNFLSYSLQEHSHAGTHMRYFDDSLPAMDNLKIATFEGANSSKDIGRFIRINQNTLQLPTRERIRKINASLYYPATLSTTNLMELGEK